MSIEITCYCGDQKILRNQIVNSNGVVHRGDTPCYVLDRAKFDAHCKYIINSGKVSQATAEENWMKAKSSMDRRKESWLTAGVMIRSVIDEHGLFPYTVGNILATNATVTQVEQHISIIQQVADWLLEKE